MSRIQEALKKARQGKDARPSKKNAFAPLSHIEYTKTKVVDSKKANLVANNVISVLVNDDRAQLFRTLRTKIAQKMRQQGWVTLGITSPNIGEGKSTIASNLAVAMAMEVNQSVLLVDMDLQSPSLAKTFDIEPEKGFQDYLKGGTDIEDVLVNPGKERLVIVPSTGRATNSSELLSSPAAAQFFDDAKRRYKNRFIVCDLPSVLPTDDVMATLNNIDCTLLVVEDGKNSAVDIKRTLQILQGTEVIGTVLNKTHSEFRTTETALGN